MMLISDGQRILDNPSAVCEAMEGYVELFVFKICPLEHVIRITVPFLRGEDFQLGFSRTPQYSVL
jgi:hypothetical protein